ncbi:MAG: hypothetical protein F4Z01_05370 [Gammaproteobacteria bacterium]|nr:hypothetical protein [Gammaproteobacteria bacterium]MYF37968.1 hypothetical protein [Gammaproteobacteria bacterium]
MSKKVVIILLILWVSWGTRAEDSAVQLLPEDGYSKSDCSGFHTHELLEPYSVKIDTFKASKKWVNPRYKNTSSEKKVLLAYKGTIQFEETIEEIQTAREITPHTQTERSLIQTPIYQKASWQPFNFLHKYRETELATTIEKIELVVNKKGVLYDIPAPTSSTFAERLEGEGVSVIGRQRVRSQPVSLCITFDLTKLEERKSSSTTKSYAFQQFDGFGKKPKPPPAEIENE